METTNDVEQQFLLLLEQNKNTIYKVCLMYSHEGESLNDNYQEVVLNLWKAFPNFRHGSKASTWVYQIALNTCITQLRHKTSGPELQPITVDVAQLVDESEEHREQIMELYRLINRLTAQCHPAQPHRAGGDRREPERNRRGITSHHAKVCISRKSIYITQKYICITQMHIYAPQTTIFA